MAGCSWLTASAYTGGFSHLGRARSNQDKSVVRHLRLNVVSSHVRKPMTESILQRRTPALVSELNCA